MRTQYRVGQVVEILNAVNPAYHLVGDIVTVVAVAKDSVMVHDNSGGALWYSLKDIVPVQYMEDKNI